MTAYWHFSEVLAGQNYFRLRMHCRRDLLVASLQQMTQAVRKRFSSPKNCTQPVAVHVDTTV